MGNNPSSEAIPQPLRKRAASKPQKLSKYRVDKSLPPHNNPLYNYAVSVGSSTGYASSYLTASLPISPVDSQLPAGDVIPEDLAGRLSRRGSQWLGEDALPQFAMNGAAESRCNSFYAAPPVSYRMKSGDPNYWNYGSAPISPSRPLVRTQSWHEQRMGRSGPPQRDSYYGPRRLSVASPEAQQEGPIITVSSHQDMQQLARNASRRLSASQVTDSDIFRTCSDASLYIPVRRRSVIQTPGVATRRERDPTPSVPTRSKSGQKSRASPPSSPAVEHFSSKLPDPETIRTKPITLRPRDIQPCERASTPCDLDYQQLGGHKFGTLRIMNGSPASTHTREESPLARVVQQDERRCAQRPPAEAQGQDHVGEASLSHEKFTFDNARDRGQRIRVKTHDEREACHDQQSNSRKTSNQGPLFGDAKDGISPLNSRSDSTSSTASHKNSSKYDSGYGSSDSNGSIRSFGGGNQEQESSLSPDPGASLRRLSFSRLRRKSELLSPSFHAVADLAQAALTSKVPSLKLGRRKSTTSSESERAQKWPNDFPTVDKRVSWCSRETTTVGSSELSHMSLSSQHRSKLEPRSLVSRASHPELYSGRLDQCSPGLAMPGAKSKAQRGRGMTDLGVPPPIPPQFKSSEPIVFQPRISSLQHAQRGNTFPSFVREPSSQWPLRYGGASQGQWSRNIERPGQFPGVVAPYDGVSAKACTYF